MRRAADPSFSGSRTILWWWRFEQDVRFQRLAGHN
jgi:hypothetical protein